MDLLIREWSQLSASSFRPTYENATGEPGIPESSVEVSGLERGYGETLEIGEPLEYFRKKMESLEEQASKQDYENILVTLDYNGVNGRVDESGITNFKAAEEAVNYLKSLGVDLAVNTGWGARTAEKIAESLEVDHWIAESGALMSLDGEKEVLYEDAGDEIDDAYADACQEKFEAFAQIDSGMAVQPNESRAVDATYYTSEEGEDMGNVSEHFHSLENSQSFDDLLAEIENFDGFKVEDGEVIFENSKENASVMNDLLKKYQPMEYIEIDRRDEDLVLTSFDMSEGREASENERMDIADSIDQVMDADNEHHGDWCMDTMIETPGEMNKTTGAFDMAEKLYGGLEDTLIVNFDDKHVFDLPEDTEADGINMNIKGAPAVEQARNEELPYTDFYNIVDGALALSQKVPGWKG